MPKILALIILTMLNLFLSHYWLRKKMKLKVSQIKSTFNTIWNFSVSKDNFILPCPMLKNKNDKTILFGEFHSEVLEKLQDVYT